MGKITERMIKSAIWAQEVQGLTFKEIANDMGGVHYETLTMAVKEYRNQTISD